MEFEDYWADYCEQWAIPVAENRGIAEEVWKAAKEDESTSQEI